MSYVALIINFIVAIPKIWAIFNEVAQWISTQKKNKKIISREKSKNDMKTGKTQKEREEAADEFLDND